MGKNTRLLIVRPDRADDQLIKQLSKEPCVIHRLPVMFIVPVDRPEQQLQTLKSVDIVLFVSRNAVQFGLPLLKAYVNDNGLQHTGDITCYAVGEATASALKAHQLTPIVPEADFSSEGLLALPQLQELSGKQLLLFKGEGGRTLLQEELTKRGSSLRCCEVYRRELSRRHQEEIQQLLGAGQLDCVIIHSGELLQNLLEVAAEQRDSLLALPVIVPGQRVAQLAAESGFEQIVISASAVADDMVSALWGWYSAGR